LGYVWVVLGGLVVLEAVDELFGVRGSAGLDVWLNDVVLFATAVLLLARAAFEPTARKAWLAFGAATVVWCAGSIAWSIAYGGRADPPYPTFADILWLAWYPLMIVGIVELIRVRVKGFELHRWMDGIAVMLVVLAAGFAFIVQPTADHTSQSRLATIVDFSYPVLDVLLIGAILGVYGLLAWRPDRMWVLIGFGVVTATIGDAVFAVREARGLVDTGGYDFVWTAGALLMALAAWVPVPADAGSAGRSDVRPTGLSAIALPLIAQGLAIAIQIYAVFEEVGRSERIITAVVLAVASVQIVLTRPRAESAGPVADPVTAESATAESETADSATAQDGDATVSSARPPPASDSAEAEGLSQWAD
jgi:hypothetical protein